MAEIHAAPSPSPAPARRRSAMGKSQKSGVVLPVPRIERVLRNAAITKNMSPNCAVFLTAAVERIVCKLVADAAKKVRAEEGGKKRLTPKDLIDTVRLDVDLGRLLASFGHAATAPALGDKSAWADYLLPIDEAKERMERKLASAERRRVRMAAMQKEKSMTMAGN